jgi:hypothetical protein
MPALGMNVVEATEVALNSAHSGETGIADGFRGNDRISVPPSQPAKLAKAGKSALRVV